MSDLLTTKDLQSILQVDRTTIYRMADDGRLPGLKVGNQWRFERVEIEAWLQGQRQQPGSLQLRNGGDLAGAGGLFPLECVQLMQDTFADALGVMMQVIDMEGQPITQPSNPGGLVALVLGSALARQRCLDLWMSMAHGPALAPRFVESPLGLRCARGLIRVGSEIRAILVVGGIAPNDWPPSEERVEAMARELALSRELVFERLGEVHRLSPAEEASTLQFVQRVADVFAHIAAERMQLQERLRRIAEITRL